MLMSMMSMTISIMFVMLKHPMSMGLGLIIQTIIIAMITGMMINTFWFSYILLITMLSGALVLFIYMASIASNEKFESSTKMFLMTTSALMISSVVILLVDQLSTSSMWSTSKKNMIYNDQVMSLMKLFNMHNLFVTLTIISYLFLTMIVISNIVEVSSGPLRKKN
uniref:NADH-ubiquinone oxidoreductase chain 6 n=1 Tax=Acanthaspis cincticrus TaxID=1911546 RepID=A0A343W8R0_9HEMI|nr:NADH dehydrogenase subunit 6 [Acanthaspis cincticrus]AVZ00750.1 NADH dehydrogenase subunit 6 [Acanthaspis cincticrus]